MSSLKHLFSPVQIGGMRLRNRLVMSPMETCYATREGVPSPRTIAYYEARARGGSKKDDPRVPEVERAQKRLEEELQSFGKEAAEKMERLAEKDAYLERKLESLNGYFLLGLSDNCADGGNAAISFLDRSF